MKNAGKIIKTKGKTVLVVSAAASRRLADLAKKGAFGAKKPKSKPKHKPGSRKPRVTASGDMQFGNFWGKGLKQKNNAPPTSGLFKGQDPEKMQNLIRSGLDALPRSMSRLSVSNINSASALPNMGDPVFSPAAGMHSGLSVQGSGAKWHPMSKKAGGLEVTAGMKVTAANVTTLQPFLHTPGNAQDAWNLPKSYVEQIRWSRLMYNLHPYIHSITNLKAFYPMSPFRLSTPESWVTQFYESVAFNKSFNLYQHVCRMNLSMKKFNECVTWGGRKQDGIWPQTGQPRWVWEYFIILEPELVEIKKDLIGSHEPQYFLRPNRDLEDLVRRLRNNDPEVEHLQGKLAEPLLKKIEKRELLPLDRSMVSAIQVLTDGSATRGTPPYQCLFTNYVFEDFVRLALMAQAQRYHFPIELWLFGNVEKGIMPQLPDLEKLRDMVTAAIQNPPFTLFFPPIVDYKAVGVSGSLISIKDDMEYAHKQYLVGMGVNENMIFGDSGIFSSNDTTGNQAFIRMMQKDRSDIEEWMRWHFFEPLAQWNNLKVNKNGILMPIIPDIEWEKTLDFKQAEDEREHLKWGWDEGLLDPDGAITGIMKKNPEEIAIKMRKAAGGPFDKDGRFAHAATAPGDTTGIGKSAGGGPAGPGAAPGGKPVEAPGGTEEGAAESAPQAAGGTGEKAEAVPAGAGAPTGGEQAP